jgi:hypothetical protein
LRRSVQLNSIGQLQPAIARSLTKSKVITINSFKKSSIDVYDFYIFTSEVFKLEMPYLSSYNLTVKVAWDHDPDRSFNGRRGGISLDFFVAFCIMAKSKNVEGQYI